MSLLLEALKKAEKSKDEPVPAPPAGASMELSLEHPSRATERSLIHDDAEPEKFVAQDTRGPERRAADQLFTAKGPPSRRGLALAGGALLIAVLAGAGYVWYEISVPRGSLVASGPRTVAPAPAPAAPQAAAPVTAPPPAATPAQPEAPAAAASTAPAAPAAAASAAAAVPTAPPAAPATARRAARRAATEPAPAGPEQIRFQRSQTAPTVDPDLAAGYQALSQGDARAARESYESALRNDPASRDAMLGLAAAEALQGRTGEALRLYQRVLELDPRDPMANAGLVALRPPGDPAQAESRLKLLLTQHPDSAALHFTLGNLYAGQSRWAEAQQEYFRAYSLEPSNAYYAFNLAVGLDQISQRRLAADHYRKALALAGSAAAGFDRAHVQRRLQELEAQR
jgi:hypothetical protein